MKRSLAPLGALYVHLALVGVCASDLLLAQGRKIPVDNEGRPCIVDVEAKAERRGLGGYYHKFYATNRCNRSIYITACYADSRRGCSGLNAKPGTKDFTLLGTSESAAFKFSWRIN